MITLVMVRVMFVKQGIMNYLTLSISEMVVNFTITVVMNVMTLNDMKVIKEVDK